MAQALGALRPVIRASVDHFHHPRAIRYQKGKNSPDGFFEDSYDYEKLKFLLLDPVSPGGTRKYITRAFDHRRDVADLAEVNIACQNSILIFDGLFTHRRELKAYWDYSIFLDVSLETALQRCAARGDGSPDPLAVSNQRYILGYRRYLTDCDPLGSASIVIDNEILSEPRLRLANKRS